MSKINPAEHTQLPKLLWPAYDSSRKEAVCRDSLITSVTKEMFKVKVPDFTGLAARLSKPSVLLLMGTPVFSNGSYPSQTPL